MGFSCDTQTALNTQNFPRCSYQPHVARCNDRNTQTGGFFLKAENHLFPFSVYWFGLLHFPPNPLQRAFINTHTDHDIPYFSCRQPNLTFLLFTTLSPLHPAWATSFARIKAFISPSNWLPSITPAIEAVIWRNLEWGVWTVMGDRFCPSLGSQQ